MHAGVVEVKEALRLGCFAPLATTLGLGLDQAAPAMLALQYVHPDSAAETDFLFCQDTGMGRQRAKRRRKEEPLRAGEFPWITGNHHLSQSLSPAVHLLLLWAYAAGNIGYT